MPNISDDLLWIKDLYVNILHLNLPDNDGGVAHWLQQLKNGTKREDVYKFFINTARQDNAKSVRIDFEKLLDNDKGKRILIVCPESAGDVIMASSLLENCRNLYPSHHIYFATKSEYSEILEGNPYIFRVIPYIQEMDNLLWLEGFAKHEGYFSVAYLLHSGTQRFLNYLHNGEDKTGIEFNSLAPSEFIDEFTVLDDE
jgi:hypothetical protein